MLCEKKHRNLEGLISIQGDLVTEAKNYDPVKAPLKSLTAKALGLSNTKLMDDLLIIIDGPRWHLLTWVLDWPKLEEQCQALLRDPNIRRPTKELKYLVIDYTQFDEWSSEEEVTFNTGIEKGYENWAHRASDEDEPIDEKGLDRVNEADYAIPILDPEQLSDDENDVQNSFLVKKEEAGMFTRKFRTYMHILFTYIFYINHCQLFVYYLICFCALQIPRIASSKTMRT